MISFNLICDHYHEFNGWFSSSSDFDKQVEKGLVACPLCDSKNISKALMAPCVSTGRTKEKVAVATVDQAQRNLMAEMRKLRDKVIESSENVGHAFPEEARKIHYGEAQERSIYGQANGEEIKELLDEGVEIAPLPVLSDDVN